MTEKWQLVLVDPQSFRHQWRLYSFLRARLTEPETNISHSRMPSWEDHVKFLASSPYRYWYFIATPALELIGACYVTKESEIGIFISKAWRRKGAGEEAIEHLISMGGLPLYANINPQNAASLAFFAKQGFKECQKDGKQVTMRLAVAAIDVPG